MTPASALKTNNMSELQKWIGLVGSSPERIREIFDLSKFHFERGAGYGHLSGLDELSNETALFYFKEKRLFLIHLHSSSILQNLDGNRLLVDLGSPAVELPSRAGKGFSQNVFPQKGIAFSSDSAGRVAFVEIFQPMSLDDYLAQIHIDPGPFVR